MKKPPVLSGGGRNRRTSHHPPYLVFLAAAYDNTMTVAVQIRFFGMSRSEKLHWRLLALLEDTVGTRADLHTVRLYLGWLISYAEGTIS